VLTAFVVETYGQLQPDTAELSNLVLADISRQLYNVSIGQPALPTSVLSEKFHAPQPIVVINTLWFVSLILALASALLGIFVKQWLREYISWTSVSSVQRGIQLRKFRYDALQGWKAPAIVTLVPGLLQMAVLLFFSGLVTLLWLVNRTVAIAASVAVGLTIHSTIQAVVLPLFIDSCPYKTPLGWMLLSSLQPIYTLIDGFACRIYLVVPMGWSSYPRYSPCRWLSDCTLWCMGSASSRNFRRFDSWSQRDLALPSFEQDPVRSSARELHSLLWLASHEEMGEDIPSRCIATIPGSCIRTQGMKPMDNPMGISRWPVTPSKRLYGFWEAISQFLDCSSGKPLFLMDNLPAAWSCDHRGHLQYEPSNHLLITTKAAISTLNSTQQYLILKSLASGVEGAVADVDSWDDVSGGLLMATRDDMEYLHLNSLCMMELLCHSRSDLRAQFLMTLMRALHHPDHLIFPTLK
jgi:hypothetical protein